MESARQVPPDRPKFYVAADSRKSGDEVRHVLRELELPHFSIEDTEGPGLAIDKALRQADALIAVAERGNLNQVLFEVGYFHGQEKPCLLVFEGDKRDIPPMAQSIPIINAPPANKGALKFGISKLVTSAIWSSDSVQRTGVDSEDPAHPRGDSDSEQIDTLIERLHEFGSEINEVQMSQIVRNALRVKDINVISEEKVSGGVIDLAFWDRDLDRYWGNPVVVEFKKTLPSGNEWSTFLHNVRDLWESRYPGTVLVVYYDRGDEYAEYDIQMRYEEQPFEIQPRTGIIHIQEFLEGLRNNELWRAIHDLTSKPKGGA